MLEFLGGRRFGNESGPESGFGKAEIQPSVPVCMGARGVVWWMSGLYRHGPGRGRYKRLLSIPHRGHPEPDDGRCHTSSLAEDTITAMEG